MAYTTIADMQVVPDKFQAYLVEQCTAKSALIRSGVFTHDPRVDEAINGTPAGGNSITLPFFKQLGGEDAVFGEDEIQVDKVGTGATRAPLLIRVKSIGDTDVAVVKGGADPLGASVQIMSDYWPTRYQAAAVAELNAITDKESGCLNMHTLDISKAEGADCTMSAEATLDAKQLLGDAADKLVVAAMHSADYTELQKQNLIQTIPASEGHVKIDTYLGYEVVVDDGIAPAGDVYTLYLLGKGAFAFNVGVPQGLIVAEKDRDVKHSRTALVNRHAFVVAPRGIQFTATEFDGGKEYAGNSDLKKPQNWKLSADHKNVPIVAIKHKLHAAGAPAAAAVVEAPAAPAADKGKK